MTPARINAVKTLFAAVAPIADQAGMLFYERLFTADPSLRPLFKDDIEEVRHSKAAQEFRLLRHELLLGENIFLAQFREAFDRFHNVFHCERSRGSRSGCCRGGRWERS